MTSQTTESAQQQPFQIAVNVQYIKDFSFESPNAPQIFLPSSAQPILDMGVNVQTRGLGDNAYEVVLMIKLEATTENKPTFIAELAYGGVFSIPPMPEEHLKYFLLVEAPKLLFPFARSILANAIRDGGFPQVLITPIDFAAMFQQTQMEQSAANKN